MPKAKRNYVKKGDQLARIGAWQRRYEVVSTTRPNKRMWICTVRFLGTHYADGRYKAPVRKQKDRDLPIWDDRAAQCPVPRGYDIVEGDE